MPPFVRLVLFSYEPIDSRIPPPPQWCWTSSLSRVCPPRLSFDFVLRPSTIARSLASFQLGFDFDFASRLFCSVLHVTVGSYLCDRGSCVRVRVRVSLNGLLSRRPSAENTLSETYKPGRSWIRRGRAYEHLGRCCWRSSMLTARVLGTEALIESRRPPLPIPSFLPTDLRSPSNNIIPAASAGVMAALVQSFPQQTGTVTMLARPSSSSGSPSHSQPRSGAASRVVPVMSPSNYRGYSGNQQYAFTRPQDMPSSTTFTRQTPTPHLRPEQRTSSAPSIHNGNLARGHYPQTSSVSTSSSGSSNTSQQRSLDDAALPVRSMSGDLPQRPYSTINLNTNVLPMFPQSSSASPVKPSPDRYRRNNHSFDSSGPIQGGAIPGFNHKQSAVPAPLPTFQSFRGNNTIMGNAGNPTRFSSVDDMQLYQRQNSDLAKRYRRRSMGPGPFDASSASNFAAETMAAAGVTPPIESAGGDVQAPKSRPMSASRNNASVESVTSSRSGSRPTSARRDTASPSPESSNVNKFEAAVANVSSPLAQSSLPPAPQAASNPPPATTTPSAAVARPPSSPAAQHLAALHKKEEKKSTKSKLRRAFSFGSSAELKRATPTPSNKLEKVPSAKPKSRQEIYEEELEAEQQAIARKQEAAGLGENIYSGQGNFYGGSTDNLSISSTASSASIMLRKMGKGMKKGGRSLVGLFRPKSVIGVPAADGPISSAAQVSMVTVEAEREKVNINANPHDHQGGGTGFPKLERNSIDAANATTEGRASDDTGRARASIMGGDRERAEVLAAVRKGILKRKTSGYLNQSKYTDKAHRHGLWPVFSTSSTCRYPYSRLQPSSNTSH